ncbi:Alpha/Beta hydrolase protein [Biscogniauxia marginata]|nr:Alpha/Beta hydrolase protein [Biscogniauxia marginata]
MDQLPPLGRYIQEVLLPTFGIYEKLLTAKEKEIKSTRRETHKYGPNPRQLLDVYYPSEAPTAPFVAKPVLVFLYGGGFVGGDRVNQTYANGLIFANIGHFFASRFGFTVVIPDYRLLSHGAKYPSGGEDVKLVVDWITETLARQEGYAAIDLFLLGNSAGGAHVATYLLEPQFAKPRETVLAEERKGGGVLLRGTLLLGTPLHWGKEDNEVLRAYFGEGKIYENSPLGLLQRSKKEASGPNLPGVKIVTILSELDPEFIGQSANEFKEAWPGSDIEVIVIKGHNHISPQLGLGTGIEREEAWGVQVVEFCKLRATL